MFLVTFAETLARKVYWKLLSHVQCSVHEKCFVNVNLLFILWPAQQVLGEIYFRINGEQRREYWWWWGVVTPLWSDDASYTFGRVGSESPKTWGQEFGRLGKDRGGRSKVSLFDSAVFGTSLWHSESPRSHTFCLPVFVFLVALLPSFVTSRREHLKCHIWFTNVRLTIEMCGREERVRRKRERGYKQVADKELPRTNTKRRGLNPTLDVVLRGSACDTTVWV